MSHKEISRRSQLVHHLDLILSKVKVISDSHEPTKKKTTQKTNVMYMVY